MEDKTKQITHTEHSIDTIKDLLDYQLSGIEMLRNDKMTAAVLTAQTNAIGKVTTLIKVGLELAKATGIKPKQLTSFIENPKEIKDS